MKTFMCLHYGFERPSPEIMAAWGKWFESVADNTISNGHFRQGREISREGTQELPLGPDSITGYSLLQAESLDHAEKLAQANPFIKSIRVYEVMTQG